MAHSLPPEGFAPGERGGFSVNLIRLALPLKAYRFSPGDRAVFGPAFTQADK
jgi:hypothetical protein